MQTGHTGGPQTREPGALAEGRGKILLVLAFPLFMLLLDVTIVVIALPRISQEFGVGISSVEWVLNVYTLVFAVLLITLGKMGDVFGRKYLFIIGLIVFTAASAMCALAPNFGFLLFARGFQAAGSAAMFPATLSILNVTFAKKGRGLALGVWGGIAGAANALGPVLGGLIINYLSWRFIFLVNIPIGIFAIISALYILPNSTDPRAARRRDYPGIATVSACLFSLTFGLVEGQKYGWTSPLILSLFGVTLLTLILFLFIEARSAEPLIQLNLFKNRDFAAGNGVAAFSIFALIGTLFLLTLFLQIVRGFSAIKTGITMLPLPLAIIVVAPIAGRFTDKIGGRWILFTGMILSCIGIFLLSFLSPATTEPSLIFPLALTGVGIGMVLAPTTTVVMASSPVEKSGAAAGVLSTMRQVGTVLGIAILGAILQNRLAADIGRSLAQVSTIPQAVKDQIVGSLTSGSLYTVGMGVPGLSDTAKNQIGVIFREQFSAALNLTMKISIVFLIIGVIFSLFITSRAGAKDSGPPSPRRWADEKTSGEN